MDSRKIKTSKFLSYLLRHNPESIGLSINANGWANIGELIGKARKKGKNLDRKIIERVVYESDKNRFDLSDDGRYIRATYGHSIPVNPDYNPSQPPNLLYHGTAVSNLESIRNTGIRAEGRQFVHLSPDQKSAREVGRRHGKPVILTIQAIKMHQGGHHFYPAKSNVWLTKHVPAKYIE